MHATVLEQKKKGKAGNVFFLNFIICSFSKESADIFHHFQSNFKSVQTPPGLHTNSFWAIAKAK